MVNAMNQPDRDRYIALTSSIVQMTLKGKIRSKDQVFQMLQDGVDASDADVFEICLAEQITEVEQQAKQTQDELKQAKATRSLRALQTIQGEWARWKQENQSSNLLADALQKILSAAEGDRLSVILQWLDPNREPALSLAQWQELAKKMQQFGQFSAGAASSFDQAILNAIQEWQRLEPDLMSWAYEQPGQMIGFEGIGQRGPWRVWGAKAQRPVVQSLFKHLALERSPLDWLSDPEYAPTSLESEEMLELAIVLRCLQQGLVAWFEKRVYEARLGSTLAMSTFLTFAVLWSQLAIAVLRHRAVGGTATVLSEACFQITLQILRSFAQRSYFPLYGGIFASFSGQYLRNALDYLDEPLKRVSGTQEKARILTLLGYSARALGNSDRAVQLHQKALEIAQEAGDRPCQVANLNHLARMHTMQQDYATAIDYSQRAVIVSREAGDRLGEANALATLGYSEVFQAQQLERMDAELYETAIDRLLQGLQLAEKLGDRQSQAVCLSSAGLAYIALGQHETALRFLEQAITTAQATGDTYLQAISLSYLAEAYTALENNQAAILAAGLGMYLLEQMGSSLWRQPANLLRVLRGRQGEDAFRALLETQRPKFVASIGVDGFDHIGSLLRESA